MQYFERCELAGAAAEPTSYGGRGALVTGDDITTPRHKLRWVAIVVVSSMQATAGDRLMNDMQHARSSLHPTSCCTGYLPGDWKCGSSDHKNRGV